MTTIPDDVRSWSVDQVFEWVKTEFGQYTADTFKENEVDGEALLALEFPDFYDMGIPAQSRRRILHAIAAANGASEGVTKRTFLPHKIGSPYKVLKDLITPEDVPKIQEFFANRPKDPFANNSDYANVVVDDRIYLPELEKKLAELYPDMMVFATNYFAGDAQNGAYSGWHTGINLSKLFVGHPQLYTVWIPLQTLTSETGGRLWFYGGEYLETFIELLKETDKKTMMLHYITIMLTEKELEKRKVTEDCPLGDAFIFSEMIPHSVDNDCTIKREILSVRLVDKNAVVDEAFLKEIEEFPEDGKINYADNKKYFNSLYSFLSKTKRTYDQTMELDAKRKRGEL